MSTRGGPGPSQMTMSSSRLIQTSKAPCHADVLRRAITSNFELFPGRMFSVSYLCRRVVRKLFLAVDLLFLGPLKKSISGLASKFARRISSYYLQCLHIPAIIQHYFSAVDDVEDPILRSVRWSRVFQQPFKPVINAGAWTQVRRPSVPSRCVSAAQAHMTSLQNLRGLGRLRTHLLCCMKRENAVSNWRCRHSSQMVGG